MNDLPVTLIFTRDAALGNRIGGGLSLVIRPIAEDAVEAFAHLLARHDPVLVFADLRDGEGGRTVVEWIRRCPLSVFVVLGDRRSEPARLAVEAGAFGTEDRDADLWRLQSLAERGLECLRLRRAANRTEKARPAELPAAAPAAPAPGASGAAPLWHLSLAMRHIEDPQSLFLRTVEGISAAMLLSRVGVFGKLPAERVYRLQAGEGCLEPTRSAEYREEDPLVRFLVRYSHLVSLAMLPHVPDPDDRTMLRRALECMGAEAIAPFFARGCLYGWLFVGRRATGAPFAYRDLEELSVLAGHISTIIDNSFLYEEAARQRTLAETLLQTIPSGILAVTRDGDVRWCNRTACSILGVREKDLLGRPVEGAGSRLADLVRRTLANGGIDPPEGWKDPVSGASLVAGTRRLMRGEECLGAMVILEDRTRQECLDRKSEELERAAFWTDLAAAMSHEIRNPLTAIKAFAQMLPKQYNDPEFRQEFSTMVDSEVNQLNHIVDAINAFANPPKIQIQTILVRRLLEQAEADARARRPDSSAQVILDPAARLPEIRGDFRALTEALAHLIVNAMESATPKEPLQIELSAEVLVEPAGPQVRLTVQDNGPGIPPEMRDRLFSPFGTLKARGLGLGLPIVRRTARDHGGRVQVDTCEQGTRVSIFFPFSTNKGEGQPPDPAGSP